MVTVQPKAQKKLKLEHLWRLLYSEVTAIVMKIKGGRDVLERVG